MTFLNIEAEYFKITAGNDALILTSDEGGPSTIDVPDGTYDGDALATALQTAMNADDTLTGTGTITFAVTWDSDTRKFTIDATAGKTIAYTHTDSDAGVTFGFDGDHAAAQTITSDNECADPVAIITTTRNEVEAWIQNVMCRRNFESQSYSEYISGKRSRFMFLSNYPVTAITRVATGEQEVIRIHNTATSTTATVAVTSTGLVLTKDGTADSTILFATYATLTLLVAAVNALGNSWFAEITSTDYNGYLSTELIPKYGLSCIDSNSAYLKIPNEAVNGFTVDENDGTLYHSLGWPTGFNNIRVDYTAGFSSANMPNDIKMAVKITIKVIFQKRIEEAFGLKSYSVGELSQSYEAFDIPKEAMNVIYGYRRVLI